MRLRKDERKDIPGLGGNSSALVELRVGDLKDHPAHPFKVGKKELDRAKQLVARFRDRGWPIMVDDEDRVLFGWIFVAAARALDLKTIRVIRQSGLADVEGLLLGTAISKICTLGAFDGAALEAALRQFEDAYEDFSHDLIGFAPGELDRIIGASTMGPEADRVPGLERVAVTWPGAVWQCGQSHVMCGDATTQEATGTLLADRKVTVAICDPPFGCKVDGFVSKKGKHADFVQGAGKMDDAELLVFFRSFCLAMAGVLQPGALVYLFIDWRSLSLLQQAAETVFGKLVNLCVWAKHRAGMGSFYRSQHELILVFAMPGAPHRNHVELGRHGRDRSNLWSWPSAASSRKGREGDMLRNHPTPKPVEMIAEANSLDAQREACEAYVKSQRAEGWVLLPQAYDDGGFSGGTMERPGLVRLLADVHSGKVDVIVVYKVDRLTRALSDFARIVDVLDAAGASFVSVTQAFNTTTSMGRLTLNVLLSFAQFEREVIAERVRDKVAQSKARGIWMGGNVPLGYDVSDRKLLPNPAEVAIILHIFRSYLDQPSVRALKAALDAQGIRTKLQQGKTGPRGGGAFSRGALYWLLSNPIYIGKLRHKEKLHDGQHDAIVPLELWEAVQAKLATSATEHGNATTSGSVALLTGMIRDSANRPMSPSFTVKQGRRYHYYVSSISKDINRGLDSGSAPVTRTATRVLDAAIRQSIRNLLLNETRLGELFDGCDTATMRKRLATAAELATQVGPHSANGARSLLERLDFSVTVHAGHVDANVAHAALIAALDHAAQAEVICGKRITMTIDTNIAWRKRGARLVIVDKAQHPSTGPRLCTLLTKALQARAYLFANQARRGDRHLQRLARLAYLAPDITAAILDGTQPATLTSRQLLKLPGLPLAWADQRKLLGFL